MTLLLNTGDKSLRQRLRLVLALFVIIFSVAMVTGCSYRLVRDTDENCYADYMSDHRTLQYEQLDYRDTFKIWNESDTYCDINSLLGFGKTYARNGDKVLPAGNGKFSVNVGGLPEKTIDASISYINVKDGIVYYRDDNTLALMSFDVESQKLTALSKDSIGEVFLTDDGIYYVQLDSGFLKLMNLDGSNDRVVYKHPVDSFVVCAGKILLLDNNMRLVLTDVGGSDDSRMLIATNVERFFMNGRIFIKSGNRIISCDPLGQETQVVYESGEADTRLCGLMEGKILIQEEGRLISCDGKNKENLVDVTHVAYESISAGDSETCYAVGLTDGDGKPANVELLSF